MKTKIKRHSRAVISVVLAISMLISCMMVGIIATDAAKVQSESVGNTTRYQHQYLYIDMSNTTGALHGIEIYWDSGTSFGWKGVDDSTDMGGSVYRYDLSSYNASYTYFSKFRVNTHDGNSSDWQNVTMESDGTANDCIVVASDRKSCTWTTYDPTTALTTPTFTVDGGSSTSVNGGDTVTFNITNWASVQPDANHVLKLYNGSTFVQNLTTQSTDVTVTGTDTTLSENFTYTVKSEPTTEGSSTYRTSENNNTATVTVYYPVYSLIGNLDNTYLASVNGGTPASSSGWDMGYVNTYAVNSATATPGVYTITVNTLTETQLESQHSSGTVNVALYKKNTGKYRFYLATDSSNIHYYNQYGKDYTVPDSGVTAAMGLYVQTPDSQGGEGGSIVLSAGRSYTITIDETKASPVGNGANPNGQIVIESTATSYKGHYALTGNVTDKYIVGSTLVKPTGVDENYWWSHYWDETAINTPVSGETDKYYITFTTTDYVDENGYCANIGFAGTDNVQYAFIKNGTAYNKWGDDLQISGNITASDNLYVYTKDSGGSLVLKPNTTYTITVDESVQQATGQPYGLITIDATTVYANAINMVRPFDVTNRRPSDLEQSNAGGTLTVTSSGSSASTSGTATVATVTHEKPMTATYTASSANSGYTFAGWYSDENCTTKVSDNLSYTPNAFSVTKTLYALYTEDAPSTSYDVTVTKSGTGDGTISVTGAAVSSESGNTVTYSAYAGATVTVTAAPSTSPLSVLASITGSGATVSGNTATFENITANKDLTVTFNEKTTYTVTLKGTNGQIKAQAYKSDKTTTSGSEVTVASGSTGTIEVPIGGYLKLTAGDADSGKEFSNFKLETGKYKRTSDQSTGTSPMTIRPTDDMTAEAVFGNAGENSNWKVRFTTGNVDGDSANNQTMKKYTSLKVAGFNDGSDYASKDVYKLTYTTSQKEWFYVVVGNTSYKFENSGEVSYTDTMYPKTSSYNSNATNQKTLNDNGDSSQTYYIYAMVNKDGEELKFRVSKTDLSGSSSTIDTTGYQRIYAMDGTLGSTASYGDTVITIGNGLLENDIEDASGNSELYYNEYDNHNVYYFDPDQNISFRVQTTVDSAQTKLGVRGFVYNGKSVDAIDDGDGVYYADITVKAKSVLDINGGTTNNPILEVIPVYYNTTVPSSEFITFYVDANTMDNKFGYNIGYYIWYQGSGNEVQGNYPGQPLLRSGTKYVGYIPKHYVSNTDTYSDSSTEFSGVLLNNLHENSSVHDECLESWGCDKINYQTFDYEDPYVISQIEDVDTIEFVAKFEETNSNHQTGTHWYNSTYNKAELKGATSGYAFPSDISAPNSASQLNGFELLRNFDNKAVDVYGNELSTVNFADSVFIISVGNQDNGSANDWDTVWMIYQGGTGEHTLIKGDIPSSFINVAAGSQLDTLKNKPAYISYEKFLDGSENAQTHSSSGATGNTGDRIDGRWLYTKSTDATNGRIRVATLGKNNDTLSFLTYDEGASGARIAYYDNSVDGITQNENSTKEDNYGRKTTFANRTTTAKAVLNEPIGYKIKGFYMLKTGVSGSDNGFSYSISDYDEMVRESATVAKYTNARDTWIVAVVEPVPASNLYLKHEMYGGPGAHSGAGDFYIKADVVNANGTVIATSGDFVDGNDGYEFEHLNSVVQKGQGYKVKVTLRTVMAGTNTFYSWFTSDLATGDYDKEITTNSAGNNARGQNTPQETVIEVSVDDLFGSKTDGSFEYTNLAYYSDIDMGGAVHVTHQKLAASLGDGTFETKIAIVNGGTETVIQDYKSGTVSVPASYTKRNSGNSIRIYLRTTPDAYSTYSNTFSDSSGTTAVTPSATVTDGVAVIQLADIPVSSLYINKGTEQKPSYEFDTTKSSYNYYTNLSKNTLKYTIQYNYNSAEYGMQSYTVTDVFTNAEMSKYVQAKTYTDQDKTSDNLTGAFFEMNPATRAEFLGLKSPYEKNVHIDFEWKFNNASYKNYKGNNEISIVVNSSNGNMPSHNAVLKFPFEVSVVTNDGLVCKTETVDGENRIIDIGDAPSSDAEHYTKQITVSAPHGHVYTLSKGTPTNPVFITAPSVIYKSNAVDAAKEYFKYWSIKKTASDTGNEVEVAKCYFVGFNYSLYEDYIVEPVYGNTPSGSADQEITNYDNSSTISFVENGRNQWNSLGGDAAYNNGDILKNQNKWPYGDRIFSNFVISFNRKDNKMIKSSPELEVSTGVIFDRVTEVKTDELTGLAVNNPAEYGITDDGKTNIESYISGGFNAEDVPAGGEYLNTTINNSKIDNKNRIELTKAFPNISHNTGENTGRKNYLYRAYSYMIEKDGTFVISNPVYFTFYDIASIANGSAQN